MTISIKNESYYPKLRTCSEKSNSCSVCLIRKKGDCEIYDMLINEGDKKIINFRLEQIVEGKDYITKDKLLEIAKNYKINLTDKLLSDYKKLGLIEPSIMKSKAKLGLIGRGTVGFYKQNTPEIIYAIQELMNKHKITLKDIKKYKDVIYEFKEDVLACYFPNYKNIDKSLEIDGIERSKFRTAIKFFAFAELVIRFKSVILPLIYPIYKDKKIKEIRVIIKDWSKRVTYNSIEDINTRLRAQRILGAKDGVIDSPEELNSLRNLKTISEVIFSKDKIEVL